MVIPQGFRYSTFPYLAVVVISVIGGRFFDYTFRSEPAFKGQSVGLIFMVGGTLTAGVLWLFIEGWHPLRGSARWVVISSIVLWGWVTLLTRLDGTSFTYAAFTTPIILGMILLRAPSVRDAWRTADVAMYGLLITIALTQVLHWTNVRPYRLDIQSRFSVPIPGLELPARWEGMFGDPNNAGIIGAILFTYGLQRRGPMRYVLAITGTFVVLLSESRTGFIALAVGLLTTLATSQWFRNRQIPSRITFGCLLALGVATVVVILKVDPTFNGRTVIWGAFLEAFAKHPIVGSGSQEIALASVSGDTPFGSVDGHSVVFDTLARYGSLAGVLAILILVLAVIASWNVRIRDHGTSFTMVLVLLVGALTYTITIWQYINVMVLPLMVAVLLAGANRATGLKAHS